MGWTNPTDASVRQVLTSARWNSEVRDNLRYLKGKAGTVVIEDSMNIGPTAIGATAQISLGENSTGNRYATIVLRGDDTYPDGMRLIRDNGGPNTTSRIVHRGTGDFELATAEQADVKITTWSTERIRVKGSNGYVGFGTNNPQGRLHAVGPNGGGCMFWDYNGFGGSSVQILAAGTVTNACTGIYALKPSTNQAAAGTITGDLVVLFPGRTSTIYTSGSETVQVTCSGGGAVSIARSAGAQTYKIGIWLTWI